MSNSNHTKPNLIWKRPHLGRLDLYDGGNKIRNKTGHFIKLMEAGCWVACHYGYHGNTYHKTAAEAKAAAVARYVSQL